MRMVVVEGITLTKPLADGKDYSAGDMIELEASVAEDWMRRGWVTIYQPSAAATSSPQRSLFKPGGRRG